MGGKFDVLIESFHQAEAAHDGQRMKQIRDQVKTLTETEAGRTP
jgi:hypothetical protein